MPALSASPYDMPGDWYVIHSYSGYENKVKANLETRIQSMHMEDRIFEVHIPMEDMVEFKGGKKQTVSKKVFPGYILVRMTSTTTPGMRSATPQGSPGSSPATPRSLHRSPGGRSSDSSGSRKKRRRPSHASSPREVGEQVRVVTGPFADFNGVIEDMNIDQQKIVVLVNIFGREHTGRARFRGHPEELVPHRHGENHGYEDDL